MFMTASRDICCAKQNIWDFQSFRKAFEAWICFSEFFSFLQRLNVFRKVLGNLLVVLYRHKCFLKFNIKKFSSYSEKLF